MKVIAMIGATMLMACSMASAQTKEGAIVFSGEDMDFSYLLTEKVSVTFDEGGIALISLDGMDEKEFVIADGYPVTAEFKNAFRLTANEDPDNPGNFYSTFYTREGAYKVPETAKAFIGEVKKGKDIDVLNLTATADGLIPASEAVILRGEESDIVLMPSCRKDAASTTNMLLGSDEPMTLPQNSYALSYGQHGLGFYDFSGSVLPANKAYLTLDAHSNGLRFSFGDTTDIDAPEMDDTDIVIYSVSGVRLTELQQGINIVNGKKVLKR